MEEGTPQPSDTGVAATMDERIIWQLATALSAVPTSWAVAEALAEEGAAAAAASFSNMAILDTSGRLRVAHGSVLDSEIATRWTELDLSDPTPLCEAIRTGLPVLLSSPEEIGERYPNLLADTLAASLNATASLPLRTAGGTLGAAGFGWARPQTFGTAQVGRLDLIAHMAAQALDRALLYERERARQAVQEEADARLLQDVFLPAILPETDHLDMAAMYLPASEAALGGDWYDVFAVDGGTCLIIGDVAGHGLRSVAVMAQLRNAARAFADEDPSPARVLNRLNRMLCRLEPDATATAIVAVWDPSARTLLRANAGHPPVLRCRRDEFSFLVPLSGGVILGADAGWEYQEEIKVLRPGTTLLFYTDGVVETRDQSIDDSMDDFRTFVEGLYDLAPKALCDEVVKWRLAAGRREDDMCVLAVRLA